METPGREVGNGRTPSRVCGEASFAWWTTLQWPGMVAGANPATESSEPRSRSEVPIPESSLNPSGVAGTSALSSDLADHPQPESLGSVSLVGGKRIVRRAIRQLLIDRGVGVAECVADEAALRNHLAGAEDAEHSVVVLILSSGAFAAFHRVREAIEQAVAPTALVVLAEQASRSQMYAALRIGAKAYVDLDADPEELVKAVQMATQDRAYLAAAAADLLVSDISSTSARGRNPRLANVDLSDREYEVVQLLCEGLSSKEIARGLHISAKTVENHRYNIYKKCEVDSIAALMRHAIQHGLVTI